MVNRAKPDAGTQRPVRMPRRDRPASSDGPAVVLRANEARVSHELLCGERAVHETLARALGHVDPFLCVAVLLAETLARVGWTRAIVLCGLGYAVTLLR